MFFLTKLATSATTHVDLTGKVLSTQFRLELFQEPLFFFPKKDLKVSKQLVYIIEVQSCSATHAVFLNTAIVSHNDVLWELHNFACLFRGKLLKR